MTWELFQSTLAVMPAGKAVGSDGIAMETLRDAGPTVQRELYEAIMSDLRAGRVADDHEPPAAPQDVQQVAAVVDAACRRGGAEVEGDGEVSGQARVELALIHI